jgi:outer membrane lipoprotein-sorting protein
LQRYPSPSYSHFCQDWGVWGHQIMIFSKVKRILSFNALTLCAVFLLLAGCASVPKPQAPFRAGATVETLAAAVTISVKAPQVSTGGRGYMVFQRPDRFHLVMLTPFGTTAMETYSSDDRLTIIIPSRDKAYSGTFAEVPPNSPLQGWRMIRLLAADESFFDPTKRGETQKKKGYFGETTSYYNGSGLLEKEVFSGGEEVSFSDYLSADGVPFPGIMELNDGNGSRVKVTFDEPEINGVLDSAALVPNLDGLTVLPLTSFRGI